MRQTRTSLLRAALLTATASVFTAPAATLYWDANGSAAGSGNIGGFWEVGLGNWNANADGTGSTTNFNNGDSAVFSAGTDGVGTYTVTLNNTIKTPLIQLEEIGLVTLAGGTIDVTGGTTINTSVLGATTGRSLNWNPIFSGTGNLTLAVHGDSSIGGGGSNTIFALTGENTFTGDVIVTSGLVGYTSKFGNAANKVVLNGGGIVNNTTGTFARNIEIGAAGGLIRNYGAATTTHTGVLSGSGTVRRSDGGDFIITQAATHTGNWSIDRGTVTVGNGTQTTDLLASSGVITVGEATGAGTLRYRLNSDLAWTTPASDLVFGNVEGTLAWQPADPARALTVNNATSFTNAALGKLQVQNGELRLTSGANVQVAQISLTNTNAANARLAVQSGAALTSRYLNIGDAGSTGATVNQTGGTITLEAGGVGMRIGHWNNGTNPGSVYNLSGGILDATGLSGNGGTARMVNIGWDGQGDMTVGGGAGAASLKTFGIQVDANGNGGGSTGGNMTLSVLNNGVVEVGGGGIAAGGTGDRVILNGGTLKATNVSNWGSELNLAGNGTIDVAGTLPRLTNVVTGTGILTVTDSVGDGRLEIDSGTGTRTLGTTIAGTAPLTKTGNGTLVITGSHTNTGELLVIGGTLNLSGSIKNPLSIDDAVTLTGEGSTTGSLTLGGTNIVFNPTTPGAVSATGQVTINGTAVLIPSAPFTGTRTVLTSSQPIINNGGLELDGGTDNYRSASISTTANQITATITNQNLTWTGAGGGFWDLNTSSGWNKTGGSPDKFFFGDNVLFDDSSTVTTVTLDSGPLFPGLMTVDSNTNNYVWEGNAGSYIAGTGSLLKKGTSTLTINSPNTFSGGTVISNGKILLRNATALGTGPVTLGDSATGSSNVSLYIDSANARLNVATPVIVSNNGTGTATLGTTLTTTGSGDNNQFTNITLQRDVTLDSNAADRSDYENISGAGNVTVTGSGRTVFSTTNTFTGNVLISPSGNGGHAQVGTATGAVTDYLPNSGNLVVNDFVGATQAEFRLSSQGESVNALNGNGTIDVNSINGVLTVGAGGGNGAFTGILQNGGASLLGFTKAGAGTQSLSSLNTYTGVTSVTGGTLTVGTLANGGTASNIGQSTSARTNLVLNGGTLEYTGATATIDRTFVSGATGGGIKVADPAATLTFNALIENQFELAGTLTKTGPGTLKLQNYRNGATATNSSAAAATDLVINEGVVEFASGYFNTSPFGSKSLVIAVNTGTTLRLSAAHSLGGDNIDGGTSMGQIRVIGGTVEVNGSQYLATGLVGTEGRLVLQGGTVAGTADLRAVNSGTGSVVTSLASATPSLISTPQFSLQYKDITFDVADGAAADDLEVSSQFHNANGIVKNGPGLLSLTSSTSSYAGATTVNAGTLAMTNATLTDTSTVNINGTAKLKLDHGLSDEVAVLNIDGLPKANGSYGATGSGATNIDDVHFSGTGRIQVGPAGGTAYNTWESANGITGAGGSADSDGDGVPNALEFVLGGDPSGPNSNSLSLLPTSTVNATDLVFVFRRTDASMALSAPEQPYVQYGSNLSGWTKAEAGVPALTPVSIEVADEAGGAGVDVVTVRIPRALAAPGTKLFARLRADIP